MAVYSALLGDGRVLESDSAIAYTAPATGTVVVRDVVITAASTGTGGVYVDAIFGSAVSPIYHVIMADTVTSYHWSGRQVLRPGEQIQVATLDGQCRYRISGYVLGG